MKYLSLLLASLALTAAVPLQKRSSGQFISINGEGVVLVKTVAGAFLEVVKTATVSAPSFSIDEDLEQLNALDTNTGSIYFAQLSQKTDGTIVFSEDSSEATGAFSFVNNQLAFAGDTTSWFLCQVDDDSSVLSYFKEGVFGDPEGCVSATVDLVTETINQ